ncbi:N-glycosylase/DNA lyase [candidate division WOR-3 bacterium]|nr:N-glycosylase/DNA lyase [candidate division WOR-3 bacterium]
MGRFQNQLNRKEIEETGKVYANFEGEIKERLKEFETQGKDGGKKEIFKELVFCILTPQSKARACWRALENMTKNDILFKGDSKEILKSLRGVRFKYKKSEYIVKAREQFFSEENPIYSFAKSKEDPYKLRDYLAGNIKGIGYKEASHFLRNIGLGNGIAILDRHILGNLLKLGVIREIPKSLSRKEYIEIEKKMEEFSKYIKIPLKHLDLTLWAKETGEVFK